MFGPLDFGTILGRSFSLVWKNPVPLLAVAGVITLIANVIANVLTTAAQSAAGLDAVSPANSSGIDGSFVGLFIGALVLQMVVAVGSQVITQGFALYNLRAVFLGDRATTSDLWNLLGRSWQRLLLLGLVFVGMGIAYGIVLGGAMLFIMGFMFSAGSSSAALFVTVPLAMLMIFALMVPLVWLMTRLSLASSVIVFEGAPVRAALRRSWHLSRGRFWRIFGIQIVLSLVFGVAGGILVVIVSLFAVIADPPSTNDVSVGILPTILGSIPLYAASAFGALLTSSATGLLYVDARFREDWLWTTLNGYAAARMSGVPAAQLPDPFITPPAPPAPPANPAPPAGGPTPPFPPADPTPPAPHTGFPGN